MTRLQKLAAWTYGITVLLVAIGGFTRGSGSGYGCEDRWPLCEDGLAGGLLPRPEFHMVVEWTHRWFAATSMVLVAATLVYAWLRYRRERGVTLGVTAAFLAIIVQAGLGAYVVMSDLDADLVSVHLGVAMVVLALLTVVLVESYFVRGQQPVASAVPDRAWRRWLAAGAGAIYLVIVLGSIVHDQYVGGWPLVAGPIEGRTVEIHFGHRVAAASTFLLLSYLAAQVVRRGRPRAEVALVHTGAALFLVNIGLGAAHVFTRVQSTGLVVAHILVAALAWSALVAAAAVARRADRGARDRSPAPRPEPAGVSA